MRDVLILLTEADGHIAVQHGIKVEEVLLWIGAEGDVRCVKAAPKQVRLKPKHLPAPSRLPQSTNKVAWRVPVSGLLMHQQLQLKLLNGAQRQNRSRSGSDHALWPQHSALASTNNTVSTVLPQTTPFPQSCTHLDAEDCCHSLQPGKKKERIMRTSFQNIGFE